MIDAMRTYLQKICCALPQKKSGLHVKKEPQVDFIIFAKTITRYDYLPNFFNELKTQHYSARFLGLQIHKDQDFFKRCLFMSV